MKKPTTGEVVLIHLADNEWGNEIMREVADEWFAAHPECMFAWVYEHAGWSLTFHRTGEVVGTANDMAVLRKDRPQSREPISAWCRREVTRPDIREVSTLKQYAKPVMVPVEQPMEAVA